MTKIYAAAAGATLLAGAFMLFSGMTPVVSAASIQTAVHSTPKGDRLDIRSYGPSCSERGWPYYEASCIRDANANGDVKVVRVVPLDHLPADFATGR